MTVVTNIRKSDLFRLQIYFLPRLKANWLFVGAIALAVIGWAVYSSVGPPTPKRMVIATFGGLIGGLAGLLITTAINFLVVLTSSSQKAGVLGHHEYEIRPDGLFERTEANEQLSKWGGIVAIDRTEQMILVRINGYLFHIIPKRSFAQDSEYDQFYERLRAGWQSAAA